MGEEQTDEMPVKNQNTNTEKRQVQIQIPIQKHDAELSQPRGVW